MNLPLSKITEIDTSTTLLEQRENGIIYVFVKENADVTIEAVEEVNQALLSITEGEPCYLLVTPALGAHANQEARAYAAKYREKKNIVAEAIVVENLAIRILANFYAKFNKPKQKVRVFNEQSAALQWLLEMKEQNNP